MDLWGFFVGFFAIGAIIVLLALYVAARIFNFLSPVLSAVLMGLMFLLLILLNLGFSAKGTLKLYEVIPALRKRPYSFFNIPLDTALMSTTILLPAAVFFMVARYNAGTIGSLGPWFAAHRLAIERAIYWSVEGPGKMAPHIPVDTANNWYTAFGTEIALTVLLLARRLIYSLVAMVARMLRHGKSEAGGKSLG